MSSDASNRIYTTLVLCEKNWNGGAPSTERGEKDAKRAPCPDDLLMGKVFRPEGKQRPELGLIKVPEGRTV